jgi:hypothetical protein
VKKTEFRKQKTEVRSQNSYPVSREENGNI